MATLEKLVILGSGPAGLTAAVYAARAGLEPLIIEGKNPGGQLMSTTCVENWPGVNSILGPTLMADMRKHALHFGARILTDVVIEADVTHKPIMLKTQKNLTITTLALIIATGATPKRLGCPGEDAYWGKGVTTCAVCDGAFYKDRPVIIVGGGDSAMETALFMTNFTQHITIIHILKQLTASKAMQDKIVTHPAITIIYNSTVQEIQGNHNHVTGILLTNNNTNQQEYLATDAVFITIGLTPNTHIFKDHLDLTSYGYIKKDQNTNTSVPGVFVAGDVADDRYRQAITSAGTGCMAALDAERYLKNLEIMP